MAACLRNWNQRVRAAYTRAGREEEAPRWRCRSPETQKLIGIRDRPSAPLAAVGPNDPLRTERNGKRPGKHRPFWVQATPFAPSWEHGSRIAGNARVRPHVHFSFTRPRPGHPPHRRGDCSLPRVSVMVRLDQPVVARPKGGRLSASTAGHFKGGWTAVAEPLLSAGCYKPWRSHAMKGPRDSPSSSTDGSFGRCARRGRPSRERLKGVARIIQEWRRVSCERSSSWASRSLLC